MALTLNTGSSQYTNLIAAWPGPGYETDLKGSVTLTGNGDGETTDTQSGAPTGTAWKLETGGDGYSVTCPSGLKHTGKLTLVAWVYMLGTPSGYPNIIGVSYDNAGGSPYACYNVAFNFNSLNLAANTNFNGTNHQYANAGSAIATGQAILVIAEFGAGVGGDNNFEVWANGTSMLTGSTGGTIGYSATSVLSIGPPAHDNSGALNARVWDVRIYDGRLGSTLRAAILNTPNDLYNGVGGGGGGSRRSHAGIIY